MGTSTTNFSFYLPVVGETGWGPNIDTNFTTLDNVLAWLKPITFTTTTGSTGTRLSIQGQGTAASDIELVPGSGVQKNTSFTAQLHLYQVTGNNAEELRFSAGNNQYMVESMSNGTGASRTITFATGGQTLPSVISSKTAIQITNDASVFLAGSSYSADSKTWGQNFCTIYDFGNSGDTRLIINSAPNGQVSTLDSASIIYKIRGERKWATGVNWNGVNQDSFDIARISNGVSNIASMSLLVLNGAIVTDIHEKVSADPTAPSSGVCRIYQRDNGAGKGQLCVLFPTGAVQVLATQP